MSTDKNEEQHDDSNTTNTATMVDISNQPKFVVYLLGQNIPVTIMESEFEGKYKLNQFINRGSYGAVYSITDCKTNERYVVKKIARVFQGNNTLNTKRLLRELKLLRLLKNNENVVTVKEVLKPKDFSSFDEVSIVMEAVDTDMHSLLQSKQFLNKRQIQHFTYELIRGVHSLHCQKIIHRDLKPSNILLYRDCRVKIADFGLARLCPKYQETKSFSSLSTNVVTRNYRAPELLLRNSKYTGYSSAVDIWSLGCIFFELLLMSENYPIEYRKVLFQYFPETENEGERQLNYGQLKTILNVLGSQPCVAQDMELNFLVKIPWKLILPKTSPVALDLLEKMLAFNPNDRITAEKALEHPFLTRFWKQDKRIYFPPQNLEKEFTWEYLSKPSKEDFKQLIVEEILLYHK